MTFTRFTIQNLLSFCESQPHLRALDVSLAKRTGARGWKMTYISPRDNREHSTIILTPSQGVAFIQKLLD